MTQLEIEAFLAVAKTGSVTAAARRLFVTQPALSRRLQTLEAELGYALLKRSKGVRMAELTEAGRVLCAEGEKLLREYLPKVIAFNAKDETAKKRYGVIADYMHLGGKDDDEKVALLIAYLRKMNDDLNIPHCIKNYGADSYPCEQGFVPEKVFLERLPEIARNAIGDACTGSNPRQPSQEEMEKLLLACYYDREIDF